MVHRNIWCQHLFWWSDSIFLRCQCYCHILVLYLKYGILSFMIICGIHTLKITSRTVFKCRQIAQFCPRISSQFIFKVSKWEGGDLGVQENKPELWVHTAEWHLDIRVSHTASLIPDQSSCCPPENTTARTDMCSLLKTNGSSSSAILLACRVTNVCGNNVQLIAGCSAQEALTASTVVGFIFIAPQLSSPRPGKHIFAP